MDGLVPSFWAKLPNLSKVNDLGFILSNFCAKLSKLSKWTHGPNMCIEIGTPMSTSDSFKLNGLDISNYLALPRLALEPIAGSKGRFGTIWGLK